MDVDNLLRGQSYAELKESYVIFICTQDPFGKDLPVYTFRNVCSEDGSTGITHEKCTHRRETKYTIKKAEREAAAMPPNRSDRWQAKFRRNFAQSDSDYGQPR